MHRQAPSCLAVASNESLTNRHAGAVDENLTGRVAICCAAGPVESLDPLLGSFGLHCHGRGSHEDLAAAQICISSIVR